MDIQNGLLYKLMDYPKWLALQVINKVQKGFSTSSSSSESRLELHIHACSPLLDL